MGSAQCIWVSETASNKRRKRRTQFAFRANEQANVRRLFAQRKSPGGPADGGTRRILDRSGAGDEQRRVEGTPEQGGNAGARRGGRRPAGRADLGGAAERIPAGRADLRERAAPLRRRLRAAACCRRPAPCRAAVALHRRLRAAACCRWPADPSARSRAAAGQQTPPRGRVTLVEPFPSSASAAAGAGGALGLLLALPLLLLETEGLWVGDPVTVRNPNMEMGLVFAFRLLESGHSR